MSDFTFRNEGSLILLSFTSRNGREWALNNLPDDVQTWCGATVVETRCFEPILRGMLEDGLQYRSNLRQEVVS